MGKWPSLLNIYWVSHSIWTVIKSSSNPVLLLPYEQIRNEGSLTAPHFINAWSNWFPLGASTIWLAFSAFISRDRFHGFLVCALIIESHIARRCLLLRDNLQRSVVKFIQIYFSLSTNIFLELICAVGFCDITYHILNVLLIKYWLSFLRKICCCFI